LETNIQNFCNFQKHMSEQVQPLSAEAWAQMMTSPSQAVQNLMGNYAQQSSHILVQMQENMAKAMGLKK
jgi:polyhydroxyalkanoate synthesis regulator protein